MRIQALDILQLVLSRPPLPEQATTFSSRPLQCAAAPSSLVKSSPSSLAGGLPWVLDKSVKVCVKHVEISRM
jgi:hypothetical protein